MFKYKELDQKYGEQTLLNVRKYEKLSKCNAQYKSHLHFNLHCKHNNITPKSLKIKSPIDSSEARRIICRTQKALLNVRITETLRKQNEIKHELHKVENELKSKLPNNIFNELQATNKQKQERTFEKYSVTHKRSIKY